jgi:uncharacterized protein YjiS (DUF1127 family)
MSAAHAVASTLTAPSPFAPFERAFRALKGWYLVHRTERQLAELSPSQLADIGLVEPRLPRSYREAMLNGALL